MVGKTNRFSGAILAEDYRERLVELDDSVFAVGVASNPADDELLQRRHLRHRRRALCTSSTDRFSKKGHV